MDIRIERTITVTKMMYGWTKYGGANHGLVKTDGKWYCQACGAEQPDELPAYMMCLDVGFYRSFIRLCASCENLVKKNKIKEFQDLKSLVGKSDEWIKFEKIFKN